MKIIGKHWQSHNWRFSGKPCLIAGGYWKWKICHEQKLRNKYACKFNRETLRVNPSRSLDMDFGGAQPVQSRPAPTDGWFAWRQLIFLDFDDIDSWFALKYIELRTHEKWRPTAFHALRVSSAKQSGLGVLSEAQAWEHWTCRLVQEWIFPSTKHPLQRKRNAWTSFYYWGISI